MTGSRERRNQQRAKRQPPAKRQKRTSRSSHAVLSNENSIEATKITNLNYDCLEKIFDRLNFEDFFNVALSNKSLQMAAVAAFNRKFGVKMIILDPTDNNPTSVRGHRIMIGGLKRCLQFVRCFGEIITDLVVWSNRSYDCLNQYIQQYCADTLTKISFDCVTLHRNSFQKQFKKVEVVSIENVALNDGALSRFVDWFPNMRHLIFANDNYFHQESCAPASFPQLQQMTISSKHQERYVDLLRANPQLQTIELTEQRMALKRSLDIIASHGSILKLKMKSHDYGKSVCAYPKDAKRLVREHPLLVEVDLPKHRFNAKTAMILVRQLNALKMFQFEVNNQAEYDDIVKQLDGEWQHDVSNVKRQGALDEANGSLIVRLTR